ncbi:MAG: response regulator [Candidatus Omnitrophica bacterium]|nr:response regulator [Candidatus Omnitrophota bacterium]
MEKKRVLMIDDEEDFLALSKLNLEETGNYEVMTLSSAREVLHEVHKFTPQVIILDLIMPSIGGLEVCEMLNNDALGEKVPIIILSALGKEVDKLKAFKLGVVDYMVKPIRTEDLIKKIEKALIYK